MELISTVREISGEPVKTFLKMRQRTSTDTTKARERGAKSVWKRIRRDHPFFRFMRLLPAFLVGFALPSFFAAMALIGQERGGWFFIGGVTAGWFLLGFSVLSAPSSSKLSS